MCHNHTDVPPAAADIRHRDENTAGEDPVPYVVVETREPADPELPSRPAVVLVTDIYGITPFYRHLAALLAGQGYCVTMPDLFHRVGPASDDGRDAALERRRLLDDRQAYADLQAVIDARVAEGDSFAVVGFCLGGSLALLSAADRPEQTTVTWYAFPHAAPGAAASAARPVDVAAGIAGSVLAFWGRDDYIDPDEVDQLARAMEAGDVDHDIVWFDGAGHSFLAGLTENRADTPAAYESWKQALAFLDTHLGAVMA